MLHGDHVVLRAIERTDLPVLLSWRNQPEFRRYFREYRVLSSAHQDHWFENVVIRDHFTRMFAIEELSTGRLMGACGLCYIDWVNRNADFSLYIGADGLYIDGRCAPDAARVMARYGFDELGLHRLWAEIYAFDASKRAFFENLGFTLEGQHRQTHWSEGQWHDSLYYSLLAREPLK